MTDLLTKWFIRDYENINDTKIREKYGVLSSCVGICCNIFLFLLKFTLGILTKSIAITGDAFNNLSDVGSCVITFIGFKMASKPADEEHPFGHGRIEYISGMMITFFILMVGVEILKTSIEKIFHPEMVYFNLVTVISLLFSIGVKLWMGQFNKKLGEKINSQAMKAAAADSMSDCFSTGATTIGVILAAFLPFSIDGYLGLMVGMFILYSGYGIAKETISPLLGNAPDPDLVKQIEEILMSYSMIIGVHDLVIHDYGPSRIMGSAHAEVPENCNVLEAHDIIDNAEKRIQSELKMPFVIHMDPVCVNNEQAEYLKRYISEIVIKIDSKMSIHDFRMVQGQSHTNLIFDVVVPYHFQEKNAEIKKRIDAEIGKLENTYFTVISFDRSYI